MYDKQRDALYNQQFNIDQTKFATESVQGTKDMVAAMKSASKELKTGFKDINIDEIEDLHEDMSELMEESEEIQEVLGRSYGVPDELDETDLMDELDALDDEVTQEDTSTDEVPNYLVNAASAAKVPAAGDKDKVTAKSTVEVDEYGLPKVPAKGLTT